MSTTTQKNDPGTTLLEILIVVMMMGGIVLALSMIMTTVLRTSPAAEGRNDDVRSLLGLITYMPEDVNSTPAGGFDFDEDTGSGCSDPGTGVNLVHLSWSEDDGTLTDYTVSYRYLDDGTGYKIYRFACETGDTTTQIRAMSSTLPDIDESDWKQGDSPVVLTDTVSDDGDVNGLTLRVDTEAGGSLDFEMRSNNLGETLPPMSPPPPPVVVPYINTPPVAAPVVVSTKRGDPVTFALPVIDAEGDGLTATIGSLPAGWTKSLSGLTATLDPKNLNSIGFVATIPYSVADPNGLTANSTITVTIVPVAVANIAPKASPVSTTGEAGLKVSVNLLVSDANSDPLTVTWSGADPSLTISVTGTVMSIISDGTVASPPPFTYKVTDPSGATASSTVTIQIGSCQVTGLTPASPSVGLTNQGRLANSVHFKATFVGPCTNLVLEFDNNETDGTYDPTFLSFGSGDTVEVQGHPKGLAWTPGTHKMTLKNGLDGPELRFSNLKVTS